MRCVAESAADDVALARVRRAAALVQTGCCRDAVFADAIAAPKIILEMALRRAVPLGPVSMKPGAAIHGAPAGFGARHRWPGRRRTRPRPATWVCSR